MAENDKFEHSLRKYWSKAHRLACASSSIPAIVDEITTGARLTLGREASCRTICQLADLLQQLKPSGYFRDVSRPSTPLRGKSLHALQAMEWQFLRLRRALNARDPWSGLCQAFPELHTAAASYQQLESASFSTVTQRLLRLYARYTDEWERFPGRQHLDTSIAA